MFDLWVQEVKTGKCWRLDHDETKPVYINKDGQTVFELDQVSQYKFFPCCPKETPKNEVIETGEQMNIFDLMKGFEDGIKS